MKQITAGLCILASLAAMCIWSSRYYARTVDETMACLLASAEESDPQKLARTVDAALERWDKSLKWLHITGPHETVDSVKLSITELRQNAVCGDLVSFRTNLAVLLEELGSIRDGARLSPDELL